MSVEDVVSFGMNTESYQRFILMTSNQPDDPIPSNCIYDFLTTIRNPQVLHKQFAPIRTFHDSPSMTKGSPLTFCNQGDEIQFVTSFEKNRMLRQTTGTVLLDSSGILLGSRCSGTIGENIANELIKIDNQMELHRCFLMRGKDVANLCANLGVTELKQDLNTKLKMLHSPKNHKSASLAMEMRSKLRGIFMKHVYPVVQNEFGGYLNQSTLG
jgi:hypothetical protein